MALTIGDVPFGARRNGAFNFDTSVLKPHTLYWEDCPKRMRATLGGETIADSRRVKRLHETGLLPAFYFPEADIRTDLLEPSDHVTHCPFKGDAAYWSIRTAQAFAANAAWSYPQPRPDSPPLAGYRAFHWAAMEAWYEEDEAIYSHPRDPYHRVDVLQSSRHVRVRIGARVVAESQRPLLLFETGLPTRYYLPRADVATDMLVTSATRTHCPYKGEARYFSARLGEQTVEDVAWEYPEPLPEAQRLPGTLCFLGDAVTLEVDGASV